MNQTWEARQQKSSKQLWGEATLKRVGHQLLTETHSLEMLLLISDHRSGSNGYEVELCNNVSMLQWHEIKPKRDAALSLCWSSGKVDC